MRCLLWVAAAAAGLRPASSAVRASCSPSSPPVWPVRFKVLQRKVPASDPDCKANCSTTTTYYDWERQANLIVIQPDGAPPNATLWDLELGNHCSYYFRPGLEQCKFIHFPVGILRPTWLEGANYTGETTIRGRRVLGWTKADFIDYYADATDCTPVRWFFHSMQAAFDTLEYSEGEAVPDDSFFTPPAYCPNRSDHGKGDGLVRSSVLLV